MRRFLVPLACAVLLAGCGNERKTVPGLVDVAEPAGTREVAREQAGVTVRAPANWRVEDRRPPALFTIQSGDAFVTGFAYRREEDLPRTQAELEGAERRLIDEVEERDEDFELRSSRLTEVDGAPAIELRGAQVIANRRLETRSVHVFKGSAEYVFEALAPEESFEVASGAVLRRLLATAELTGRVERQRDEDS